MSGAEIVELGGYICATVAFIAVMWFFSRIL